MHPGAKRARTGATGRQAGQAKRQQRASSADLLPGGHGDVFGSADVVHHRQGQAGEAAGSLGAGGSGYHVLRASDPPGYEVLCLLPGYMINEVKVGGCGGCVCGGEGGCMWNQETTVHVCCDQRCCF